MKTIGESYGVKTMKTIYLNLLVQIIKCLISTINWEMIRNTVEELMDDTSLTGAQKRDVVLSRLSFLAKEFGVSLLNLTVEVAVQKMKQ
jgi:hypothetical protein